MNFYLGLGVGNAKEQYQHWLDLLQGLRENLGKKLKQKMNRLCGNVRWLHEPLTMVLRLFRKSSRRKSPLFSTLLIPWLLFAFFFQNQLIPVTCPAPHWPLVPLVPAWVPTIFISDIKWASYDFCDANKTTCKLSQAKAVWQSYVFSKQPLTEAGEQLWVCRLSSAT